MVYQRLGSTLPHGSLHETKQVLDIFTFFFDILVYET